MTNKEWLDYLANNAPDELAAWFDAEHVETKEQAYGKGGMVGGSFCDTPEQGEVAMPLESWREYLDTASENEDSREQLEADIRVTVPEWHVDMVIGWLDRQAAITAEETSNAWMNAEHQDGTLDGDTAALNAKIAALEKKLRISWEYECKLQAERDKFKEANDYHATQYELASEDCDRLQAQVDELKAERVKLRSQICKLEDDLVRTSDERDNWKANCEDWKKDCERYRSKFGKCLDYADAIHALMDDEGMA